MEKPLTCEWGICERKPQIAYTDKKGIIWYFCGNKHLETFKEFEEEEN